MADAAPGAVLGFDYGRRRIGVAVGQTVTRGASALTALRNLDAGPDWAALEALLAEWRPTALVVGVPYNADGTPHDLTHEVLAFAQALGARAKIPVHTLDERLSSLEAAATLRAQRGMGRRRARKEDLDAAAAAVILRDWFDL